MTDVCARVHCVRAAGVRYHMDTHVVPTLRQGLMELVKAVEQDKLQVGSQTHTCACTCDASRRLDGHMAVRATAPEACVPPPLLGGGRLQQVAAGVQWDDGVHMPRGWRPFSPLRWLADWIMAQPGVAERQASAASPESSEEDVALGARQQKDFEVRCGAVLLQYGSGTKYKRHTGVPRVHSMCV